MYHGPVSVMISKSSLRFQTFKIKIAKIQNVGVPKTGYHFQIKIEMQTLSQEAPASFKASNHDLKDMYVLCNFKIKIKSQIWSMGVTKPVTISE